MLWFIDWCVRKTGCLGFEGLEVAAVPSASSAVLGGIRTDEHGLPEPGVWLLLVVVGRWWWWLGGWC